MFKLNNKGFAFSTILYGLMIMGIMIILVIISTMQTNRVTNKNFVKTIEDELNRFSMTEAQFSANNSSQQYIVPMGHSGWYKIEMFGSQGASNKGGKGAYTSGLVWLQENAHLYFYVGNNGAASLVTLDDSYNLDADITSSAIMVAAGGGDSKTSATGGAGGSILGLNSSENTLGAKQNEEDPTPRPATGLKGGHGYYNGTAGTNTGGGGSSYIAGYAGVWTKGASEGSGMTKSSASYTLEVQKDDGTYDEVDYTPQFINGFMLEGVHSGAGYAKIKKVSSGGIDNPPAKTNSALSGTITSITDCISGMSDGSSNKNNYWKEIQVISSDGDSAGKNIAYGKNSTDYPPVTDGKITVGNSSTDIYDGGTGNVCLTLSGFNTPVNEVAVWHNIGLSGIQHTLKVKVNSGVEVEVTKPSITNALDTIETSNGLHYSAWSINSNDNNIPNGTYYIQSAADSRLFVTNNDKLSEDNKLYASSLNYFDGSNKQKWTLTNVNGKYIITSGLNGKVFQTFEDGKISNLINDLNSVSGIGDGKVGTDKSHGEADKEKWSIVNATGDSYYFKVTLQGAEVSLGPASNSISHGTILYQRDNANDSTNKKIERAMRFRLIPVDY